MFRPGIVQPVRGVPSRTRLYRTLYAVSGPLIRVLRRVAPNLVTTTEDLGRAMIAVAKPATSATPTAPALPGRVLRPQDINRLGAAATRHN